MGFESLGRDVKVSDRAVIYNPERTSLGDLSRIDDFCVVSGSVRLGRNVHVAVFCNLAGGRGGVDIEDFAGISYGCHVIAQSDDYSGRALTGPTVPAEYTAVTAAPVRVGRHSILGSGTVVLPGVVAADGTATGALTLLNHSTEPWGIYVGSPARRLKERERGLLDLEAQLLDAERRDGPSPER